MPDEKSDERECPKCDWPWPMEKRYKDRTQEAFQGQGVRFTTAYFVCLNPDCRYEAHIG